ncbi:myb/SANT-like DNA-binding domain-containing protein 3 [Anabrus simplex]|uniref:myb/SANT-like DNA-binding domain-containing protein 3 n=1 Tax=Anabrus simplex TaxID=316456 RepID=UPI0035A38280
MENKVMKRPRNPNFSPHENFVLLDLAEKYKAVIENKKTDGVTLKEKDKTWLRISQEFSCVPGTTPRSHTNLKGVYENLKRRAIRASADEKVEMYKTGGGPSVPSKVQDIDKRVLGIIEESSVCIPSTHDSDAGYAENKEPDDSLKRHPSTSNPLDTLRDIANGDFGVDNGGGDDDDDDDDDDEGDNLGQCSHDYGQTPLHTPTRPSSGIGLKHQSRKTHGGTKKRKLTATESISSAAEVQQEALLLDMALKKEKHKEELEIFKLKKGIIKRKNCLLERKNAEPL